MDDVLKTAKFYHNLGWAVIWLHPRSKRPVESGWTTGPRHEWSELRAQYQPGMNVGVRLGTPSKIGDGFLACLDVDVRGEKWKGPAKEAAERALEACGLDVKKGMPPQVVSGKGFGSAHYYFVTAKPFRQITFGKEKDAWEVVAYSEGRQMVLPPSVHPETGRLYQWKKGMPGELPTLSMEELPASATADAGNGRRAFEVEHRNFRAVEGAELLTLELSAKMLDLLQHAKIDDRSSALVPVTRALLSIGASTNEILTILTDPQFALSRCAYDHVQSGDRARAAQWLWRYTVERLTREQRAEGIFKPVDRNASAEAPKLEGEALEEQNAELAQESWRSLLHKTKEGGLRTDVYNVELLLRKEGSEKLFRLDEFSKRIYYGAKSPWGRRPGDPITDADIHLIQHWLSERFELNVNPQLIWAAITVVAKINSFHPIRTYLRSLEWDGKPRIDTWLRDYLGAVMPEPYLTEVSRKILLAAVARVMRPGTKFDHILVLEGAQGIGKSTAIADLAGEWFLGSLPNIRDKDSLIALQGVWFVEISELATLRRVDVESYKAFFSASVDKFRVPYGRGWEEFPRQCIFIGTTNHEDYLSDNTGNRRFWPVKVTRYVWKSLSRDREQLFAEALAHWETFGEPLHLENDAHLVSQEVQGKRVAENEEATMRDQFRIFVEEQANLSEGERFDFTRFRLSSLFEVGGPWSNAPRKNFALQLAGRVLRCEGFEKYLVSGINWWRKGKAHAT